MGQEIIVKEEIYRLRAGSPMPTGLTTFVTHTFKAERTNVDMYLYTNELKGSDQFRGQGGVEEYISANFTRLLDVGGESFQGSVKHSPEIVEEDTL